VSERKIVTAQKNLFASTTSHTALVANGNVGTVTEHEPFLVKACHATASSAQLPPKNLRLPPLSQTHIIRCNANRATLEDINTHMPTIVPPLIGTSLLQKKTLALRSWPLRVFLRRGNRAEKNAHQPRRVQSWISLYNYYAANRRFQQPLPEYRI